MKSRKAVLLPKEKRLLELMGENIKLARLRRRLTATLVADRANISRSTLWHVEKGSEHISIGVILHVLAAMGLTDDLKLIAGDDVLGRKLQDLDIATPKRAPKRK